MYLLMNMNFKKIKPIWNFNHHYRFKELNALKGQKQKKKKSNKNMFMSTTLNRKMHNYLL